jgi:hypothetical protein
MAFPRNVQTPRGMELQAIIMSATPQEFANWPMPTEKDYVLVGGTIALFNYIDLSLRRLAEVFDHANVLTKSWQGKGSTLNMAQTAIAVRTAPVWAPGDTEVLEEIEEHRRMRNMFAHCAFKRFPHEDALAFFYRNSADYEKIFGVAGPMGHFITMASDLAPLKEAMKRLEKQQTWLGIVAGTFEMKLAPTKLNPNV